MNMNPIVVLNTDRTMRALLETRRALIAESIRGPATRSHTRDLTWRQEAVLLWMATQPGPHECRTLHKAIGVNRPTITRAIDVLQGLRMARRYLSPDDRRVTRYELTQAGRDLACRIAWLTMNGLVAEEVAMLPAVEAAVA